MAYNKKKSSNKFVKRVLKLSGKAVLVNLIHTSMRMNTSGSGATTKNLAHAFMSQN